MTADIQLDEDLASLVRTLDLFKEIRYLGKLSQSELHAAYAASDIAISTAIYEATFYYFALYEALENGIGCLIPDIPMNRQVDGLVIDIDEFSFDPTDPESIALCIGKWQGHAQELPALQIEKLRGVSQRTWLDVALGYESASEQAVIRWKQGRDDEK